MSREGERNRRQRAKKQREEAVFAWGGKCVQCGEADPSKLEFHHRDPSTKFMGLSYMFGHFSDDRILEEMEKCDLLCKPCHTRETVKESRSAKHGTRSKYNGGCRCYDCVKSNRDYEYERRTNGA